MNIAILWEENVKHILIKIKDVNMEYIEQKFTTHEYKGGRVDIITSYLVKLDIGNLCIWLFQIIEIFHNFKIVTRS